MAEGVGRHERPASSGSRHGHSLRDIMDQNTRRDGYVNDKDRDNDKDETIRDAEAQNLAAGATSPADPQEQIALIVAQVKELSRALTLARDEMNALHVKEVSNQYIPSAHLELDAIAAHAVAATNEILDACETIDPLAKQLDPEAAAKMLAGTMRIYTACGFQDLVGQRIRKVLRALASIDTKMEHIIQTFGGLASKGSTSFATTARDKRSAYEWAPVAEYGDGPIRD